ncbi:hypothetical protein DPMN_123047 [Dreissena polymorpha]|uniref:C-type lectin domain-containing protein n=1 Tax=Dreissena polymorpha TaxID=45954 RepID=A0A9D4JSJ1_DREPO|nr:hypothetical protein DPMN_123047 [Dreissena polymorpha]
MGIIHPANTNLYLAEHSGTTVNYTYWAPGQPNAYTIPCNHIYRAEGWKWGDRVCSNVIHVVCEYE